MGIFGFLGELVKGDIYPTACSVIRIVFRYLLDVWSISMSNTIIEHDK